MSTQLPSPRYASREGAAGTTRAAGCDDAGAGVTTAGERVWVGWPMATGVSSLEVTTSAATWVVSEATAAEAGSLAAGVELATIA